MIDQLRLQRTLIVVGLTILAVGFIVSSDTLHRGTNEVFIWIQDAISNTPVLGMIGFVLLAMLSAMLAFFSSAALAPVAILAWGRPTTVALLWLGWFLGGIASFCIGRFLGRSVAAWLVGAGKIADWEATLGRRTSFRHILLFQAVIPSEIPGYLLGILRYRFLFYLAALAITEVPYALAVVYLGDNYLEGESLVFLLAGGAAVVLGVLILLWSRWRQ
jgi:uncharacterized membrane protein YdjX (TVP38/TMEM64 family)